MQRFFVDEIFFLNGGNIAFFRYLSAGGGNTKLSQRLFQNVHIHRLRQVFVHARLAAFLHVLRKCMHQNFTAF